MQGQHYDLAAEQMKAAAAAGQQIVYNSQGVPVIMMGQQPQHQQQQPQQVQGRGGYVNQYGQYQQVPQHQMQQPQQMYTTAQQLVYFPDGRSMYVPVQTVNMGMGGMVPMQMVATGPHQQANTAGMMGGYPIPGGMMTQQQQVAHGAMHHQGQVYIPGQPQQQVQMQQQLPHQMVQGHQMAYHPQSQMQQQQGPPPQQQQQHTYRNLHASPSALAQAAHASSSPLTVNTAGATAASPAHHGAGAHVTSPATVRETPAGAAGAAVPATSTPVSASPATVPTTVSPTHAASVGVAMAATATQAAAAAPVAVVAPTAASTASSVVSPSDVSAATAAAPPSVSKAAAAAPAGVAEVKPAPTPAAPAAGTSVVPQVDQAHQSFLVYPTPPPQSRLPPTEAAASAAAAASSAAQADLPPKKPRNVLTYKSKTGEPIDIKSFQHKSESTPGHSAPSTVTASPVTLPQEETAAVAMEAPAAAGPDAVPASSAAAPPSTTVPAPPANTPVAGAEVKRAPVEISEPLQQLRISSPTLEEMTTVLPSPLVKNTNIPVTLAPSLQSGFSISKAKNANSQSTSPTELSTSGSEGVSSAAGSAKESACGEANVTANISAAPATPASTASASASSALPIKVPAKNRNDFNGGDMLDAYTMKAATATTTAESPSTTTPAVATAAASAATPTTTGEPEIADSWEDESAQAALLVDVAPAKRRLVPNGGKFPPQVTRKVIVYTKQDMLSLRPAPEAKNPLPFYDNIVAVPEGSSGAGGVGGMTDHNRASNSGGGSGNSGKMSGSQGGWPKKEGRNSYGSSGGVGGNADGAPDWNRDTKLPPAQNLSGKGGKKGGSGPPPPMPKKQISDPMELLSLEVVSHLNKITPQTFEKLSQTMMSIYVGNTEMLDRLIELIFEKAVQEPNFTVVYADLCSFLSNNANHWLFFTIVRDQQSQDYFWIKDFNFEPIAAGPYYSQKECIAVADSDKLPPMKPMVSGCEAQETVLCGDVLMKVSEQMMCLMEWRSKIFRFLATDFFQ